MKTSGYMWFFTTWNAAQAMLSFGRQKNKNTFCIDQHIFYEKAEPSSALCNFNAGEFGPLSVEVKRKFCLFFTNTAKISSSIRQCHHAQIIHRNPTGSKSWEQVQYDNQNNDKMPVRHISYAIHSCMPCFTQTLLTACFKKLWPDNSLTKIPSGLHPAKWNQDFKIVACTPGLSQLNQ